MPRPNLREIRSRLVARKGFLDSALADRLCAERGVRHGQINVITVEATDKHATPSGYHHHHRHLHLIPRT